MITKARRSCRCPGRDRKGAFAMTEILNLGDRFWSKVDIGEPEECWEWQASRHRDGYGQFSLGGVVEKAHRLIVGLKVGDEGLALHRCDNPPCVNPAHLYIGTRADNVRDSIVSGRHRGSAGESNGSAKATAAQVLEARSMRHRGLAYFEIAAKIGFSKSWAEQVCNGRTWPDGPWPDA